VPPCSPFRQDIEDHLLITPKLDEATLSDPQVKQLLEAGLRSPSVAIRVFCLAKVLGKMAQADLSDALWLAALSLVGDESVEVSQRAVSFVAFSSPDRLRLEAARTVLERLAATSPLVEMRVLDLAVKAVGKNCDLLEHIPVLDRLVDRAIALCATGDDPLVRLGALELVGGELVRCSWGMRRILESGLIGEAAAASAVPEADNAAALMRFVGGMAAAGGERALEAVLASAALKTARTALNDPARVNEVFLDGCLCVLEGVGSGSDGGRLHLCESGLLEAVLDHVRSGDVYVRIRSTHCVAEVVAGLSRAGPKAREAVHAKIRDKGQGLVAKLLHLASQPLLTEQRTAVFRLLHLLIREMSAWAFASNPSLLPFITNRSGDTQKDAAEWRFAMVQQALANKDQFATEAQAGLLTKYVREGPFYTESRADVKSETN
jgi:hypothetical protein